MKVAFWTTTFQADTQSLACYLANQANVEVRVAMPAPEPYLMEPVQALYPFGGELLDREDRATLRALQQWEPDLLVVDNHLPGKSIAPRILVLWHGYGWRVDDLRTMKKKLKKMVGDTEQPNDRFRWQAFGPLDQAYRATHSRFHPDNIIPFGSAYSDLLLPGAEDAISVDKASLQDHYDIDLSRPTVLLGTTWHHGGAFSQWGDDTLLQQQLIDHLAQVGANLLIRLHDRHRYERGYAEKMESFGRRHPHVQTKFKNEHPDSLVDLLLSDVMVSNYSSFLNTFYYTGRPSLHINPHPAGGGESYFRTLRRGKVRKVRLADADASWKFPPNDIGGLQVHTFPELLQGIEHAIATPDCCAGPRADYLTRHISNCDGSTRRRIFDYLERWVHSRGAGSTD